jgi:hypothetical protein
LWRIWAGFQIKPSQNVRENGKFFIKSGAFALLTIIWLVFGSGGRMKMDFVGSSLCRLQDSVNRFLVPSAALRDVGTLKAQIELRRRALRDIEVIRCRLRPFMRCDSKRLGRRLRNRRGGRSSLADSTLGVSFGRS